MKFNNMNLSQEIIDRGQACRFDCIVALTPLDNVLTSRDTFETPNPIDAVLKVEHGMTTHDLFIKDAFLVFRALCKLTMKALNNERLAFSLVHASLAFDNVTIASVI